MCKDRLHCLIVRPVRIRDKGTWLVTCRGCLEPAILPRASSRILMVHHTTYLHVWCLSDCRCLDKEYQLSRMACARVLCKPSALAHVSLCVRESATCILYTFVSDGDISLVYPQHRTSRSWLEPCAFCIGDRLVASGKEVDRCVGTCCARRHHTCVGVSLSTHTFERLA